jgi:hypothetical protein
MEEKKAQILTYMAMRALRMPWRQQAKLDFWDDMEILAAAAKMPSSLIAARTLRPMFLEGKIP